MNEQSHLNKKAWEHKAYDFWIKRDGTPEEKAKKISEAPMLCLKNHKSEFVDCENLKIANICGSNGRKAVPLALLGAEVTVFDISEENRKYALELANCAKVEIAYEVGDVYDINTETYSGYFDVIYMEGGILHYFDNLEKLMALLSKILKSDGKMILSDFHPLRKILDNHIAARTLGDYFDAALHRDDIAYKKFYENENENEEFPDVILRYYTLSDIMNAILKADFVINKFEEHPDHENKKIPGEFTIVARKNTLKRIYIVGNVGSGKTTLSKKLSKKLGVRHFEVDNIVHKKTELGRIKQSEEEQIKEFKRINAEKSWIIEGTFRPSCKYLLEVADLIIFLDPPVSVRKYRICKRFIKQQIGLEKSNYKSDLSMLKAMIRWTNDFEKTRNEFEMMLCNYECKLKVVRTRKEIKSLV